MTRLEQRLLLAIGAVLLFGAGAFVALGGLSRPEPASPQPSRPETSGTGGRPAPEPSDRPRPVGADGGPTIPGEADPDELGAVLSPSAGGMRPGLRAPSGDDFSDPKKVKGLLREHLAAESVRWDHVASLLAVLREPLDADVKAALLAALRHGNAAGAMQAYQAVHDGTVVPDLLRLLDDPTVDAHDRGTVLVALSTIPGANAAEVVTGIESRLTGDPANDVRYLGAIARTGGVEAARALVDAISRAKDPLAYGPAAFRELDFRAHPEAADHVASVLRTTTLSPEALGVVVELAGRAGATRSVVDALLALDADSTPEPVRKRVLSSLAATADEAAFDRLLAVAVKGADYASVAAKSIGDMTSMPLSVRPKLVEIAKTATDEALRIQSIRALGANRVKEALPVLLDGIRSGASAVRTESVIAAGRIGPSAAAAVEVLRETFDGGDEALRQHVAIALGKIATPEAKALLIQFQIRETSPKVKTSIGGALKAIDPAGPGGR